MNGTTQLSLFDQFERARKTDPPTSVEAAAEIEPKARRLRATFVANLKRLGGPATAQEIAAVSDAAVRESVRKRAAECCRLGEVSEIGTKRCSVTGKRAMAYWVNNGRK